MLLLKLWIKCSRRLSLPIQEAVFCRKQVFLVFPPPPFRTVLISESAWKGPCCETSLLWSLGFGSDLPQGSLQDMAAGCNLTEACVTKVWTGRAFLKMALLHVTATVGFVRFSGCLLPVQVFVWTALWSILQASDFQMISRRLSGIFTHLVWSPTYDTQALKFHAVFKNVIHSLHIT